MTVRPVWIAAFVMFTVSASAQSSDPAARAYQHGLEALRGARYGEAALAFEDSYRASPVPGVLYNLALAYRGAGRSQLAVETFARYLREGGAAVPADRRAAVERAIGELRVGLSTIECQVTPRDATLMLDGRVVVCDGSMLVDPGEHVVAARADGYLDAQETVRPTAGVTVTFRRELVRRPAPVVTPPVAPPVTVATVAPPPAPRVLPTPHERPAQVESTPVYHRWWFWTAIGAAVVGGAVLAVVLANQTHDPQLDTFINVEAIHAR